MYVTRLEQCAYIKIAVLRGRNAREWQGDLVEAMGSLWYSLAFLLCFTAIFM